MRGNEQEENGARKVEKRRKNSNERGRRAQHTRRRGERGHKSGKGRGYQSVEVGRQEKWGTEKRKMWNKKKQEARQGMRRDGCTRR